MKLFAKTLFAGLIFASLSLPVMAGAAAATAKTLLNQAESQARREKKNVMVIFHASWCGWCKKMDAMLESPKCKPLFDKNFVITHVVVLENPANKQLENPGGEELMESLGGKGAGLPFFAIISPKGEKLADSILPKTGNMGFPSEPNEVTGFMAILKTAAPKLSEGDRTSIETYLRNPKR